MADFLHGTEVIDAPDGARPVGPPSASVIGLVGTSYDRYDVEDTDLRLVTGLRSARERYAGGGTILDAIEAIYAQGVAPPIVVVNACDPAADTSAVALAATEWAAAGGAIQLPHARVSGVEVYSDAAGNSAVPGAEWSVDNATGVITVVDNNTLAADATGYVSYDYVDVAQVTVAEAVAAAARLLDAASEVGSDPEVLVAPGFTGQVTRSVANVVDGAPGATGLAAIAERLRGIVVADTPGTTRADAVATRDVVGSRRVMLVDPQVRVLDADGNVSNAPASAFAAGVIARTDRDPALGWWASPSNQPVLGIAGTSRPVSFALGDVDSEANALNENEISTFVRINGWRLWGGYTCSGDSKWRFVSVVRTHARITRALLDAHLWAVDRNISRTYVSDVVESVNAFLRELESRGAILGGRCWADPELNPNAQVAGGRVYFDFDFTPAYPAERVTFRSHLVDDYVETIF